ncbi:MAG: 3-deoxy-manno-octulosonate cytidylyltransferase [Caulobacterales bacterium 32-69-10]|nr:MAG: 3-deoxy-manno-octulosonate cytidylyltransferase [Caulobacterales bacterium 32-69-10]
MLVVIPARYASGRLPGKPLVDIAGKPMIIRTFERCISAVAPEHVIIATDDDRIRTAVEAFGIQCVMTSSDCLTGTDRIAEVADLYPRPFYINVQGDEPCFNPDDITKLIKAATERPESIWNGYCPIRSHEEFVSRGVPKFVFSEDERLLYASRAPVPGSKSGEFVFGHRQVCAYSFPAAGLKAFRAQGKKTPLEAVEDIEILRFLELGFEVRLIAMSEVSVPVDHPSDVAVAERRLLEMGWS